MYLEISDVYAFLCINVTCKMFANKAPRSTIDISTQFVFKFDWNNLTEKMLLLERALFSVNISIEQPVSDRVCSLVMHIGWEHVAVACQTMTVIYMTTSISTVTTIKHQERFITRYFSCFMTMSTHCWLTIVSITVSFTNITFLT